MQSKTKEDQSNEWHFIKASEEKKKTSKEISKVTNAP